MSMEDMTDEELERALSELEAERGRRAREEKRQEDIARLEKKVDDLLIELQQMRGVEAGAEWTQPTGAHDAYPRGAVVRYEGDLWESLISANVWQPGVSGWRKEATEDEEGGPVIPEWVQPTGGHDAYQEGERVSFEGRVYESVADNNVWSPADYPEGWQEVEGS